MGYKLRARLSLLKVVLPECLSLGAGASVTDPPDPSRALSTPRPNSLGLNPKL